MEKTSKKKIFSVISFCLSLIIFIFALTVFIITLSARAKNRPAVIFGYSMAVVATGSMEPEIMVGDLVIIKSCDISSVEVGQNAVFIGQSDDYKDKCIVHKVVEISTEKDEYGNDITLLTTMGIATGVPDRDKVTAENFIGIEIYNSAPLGTVMLFLQNPINWAYMLVILVAVVIIVIQIKRIVKSSRKPKLDGEEEKKE